MTGPISTTPDMSPGYPDEWQELERSGTGDGIRVVEWNAVDGAIRVSGPVIQYAPRIHPA